MTEMQIKYSINISSEYDIYTHLNKCSEFFKPPLQTYVDVRDYSKKIFEKSTRFEAYSEDNLIGLVSVYINDSDSFVTNFSIDRKFHGKGVSKNLLERCVRYIRKLGHTSLFLEVKCVNNVAINFYKKNKFAIIKNNFDNYLMELKINNRDYNKELKDTSDHKYAYNFDFDIMHHYMIKSFEPFFKGDDVLELGSFKGDFTKRLLPYFSEITCIEASDEAIQIAKSKFENVDFHNCLFEEASLPKKYNNIILTHVLEHIDDPVGLLKKIKSEWLTDDGNLFIVCPNANAPSRQIAVKMGLISHNAAITKAEKEHGHRITYSLDTLERDVKSSGLNVIHRSGIFFKALANFQWDRLLNTDIISKEYLDGCYQLGQQYPDLCSSIFLVCKK